MKFAKPVAPSTIVSGGKLVAAKVTLTGLTTDATTDAKLDSTNTVLTITLNSGEQLVKNNDYTFTISGVTDAEGKPFPHYASALTATETVAPAIKSVTATTKDTVTRTVTLTLTEPVAQPTVKVNGKFAGVAKVSDSVYTLTTTEDLEIDKSYEVEVIGLTDTLGNAAANSLKTNVTVTRDTAKPTFTVKAVNEKTIDVVFDKEVTASSIAVDSFKVTKLLNDGTTNQTIAQANLGALQADKKTVRLTLSGDVFDNATQTSREISVAVSGIKDTVGNTVTAKTEKLTVTRDAVKPTITSVTQTFNNATQLKVVFSKAVASMGTSAGDVFTVVDANGNQVLVGGSAVTASVGSATSTLTDGQHIATVTLSAALPKSGTYKLVAKEGSISDTAGKANKNDAQSVSFAYTVPTATIGTLTATITNDKDGSAIGTAVTESGVAANRVAYVKFNRADVVNGFDASTGTYQAGAADNPANYTVAGTPLPEGTVVTFVAGTAANSNKAGVKLDFNAVADKDLPTSLKSGGKLAISVANVKAETGAALSYTTTEIDVKDTTAPTVTAAYLSGDVSEQTVFLELTFSETVNILSAVEGEFTVNFSKKTDGTLGTAVGDNAVAAVYKSSADETKVVIKLVQSPALDIDLTKAVTLNVSGLSAITDKAITPVNLAAKSGIEVSVFATE